MSKFLFTLLAFVISTANAAGYDFTVGQFGYNVISLDDMTVSMHCIDENISEDVVIPATVTYQGREMRITSLMRGAFYNCKNLESVVVPETINAIPEDTFGECRSLKSVTLPAELTEIGRFAFYSCEALKTVVLPKCLRSIGQGAFSDCESLNNVCFPDSLQTIGAGAFSGCYNITSIILPENIQSVGGDAFNHTSIRNLVLPKNILNYDVCNECDSLHTVSIYGSVTSGQFMNCHSLRRIELYGKEQMDRFYCYTRSWSGSASSHCVDSLIVYDSVERILAPKAGYLEIRDAPNELLINMSGNSTSYVCNAKSIYTGRRISFIGMQYGYEQFDDLTNLILGKYARLSDFSLVRFPKLQTITLNDGVEIFDHNPGFGTIDPSEIKSLSIVPPECKATFSNKTYLNCKIYVPKGSAAAYKTAEGWKKFWNIIEDDNMPTSITSTSIGNSEETTSYYDLSGRRVSQPSHGMFIERSGGKARKVLLP